MIGKSVDVDKDEGGGWYVERGEGRGVRRLDEFKEVIGEVYDSATALKKKK